MRYKRLFQVFSEGRKSMVRSGRGPLNSRRWFRFVYLVAPTAVLALVALVAMQFHRPTPFNLSLTVKGVSFTNSADTQIASKLLFSDITLDRITHAELTGGLLEPAHAGSVDDHSASRANEVKIQVDQLPTGGATLLFFMQSRIAPSGFVERLDVPSGARTSIAVTDTQPAQLSVSILDRPAQFGMQFPGEVRVQVVHARVSGLPTDNDGTFHVSSKDAPSVFSVYATGSAALSTIQLTPRRMDPPEKVIMTSGMEISTLEFLKLNSTGPILSTIAGDGNIFVGGRDHGSAIAVKPGDYVVLAGLNKFYVQGLVFDPERGTIQIEAGGDVRSLRSGPAGETRERTLTWLDYLWNAAWSIRLFTIITWGATTSAGAYTLIRKVQS